MSKMISLVNMLEKNRLNICIIILVIISSFNNNRFIGFWIIMLILELCNLLKKKWTK